MDKISVWKWLLLLLFVSLSAMTMMRGGFTLGLDLQGGSSFVVEIDAEKVEQDYREEFPDLNDAEIEAGMPERLRKAQESAEKVIRGRIDTVGIAEPQIYRKGDRRIEIQLPGISPEKQAEAKRKIEQVGYLAFHLVHEKNDELVEKLFNSGDAPEGYKIETLHDDTRRWTRKYYVLEEGRKEGLSAGELKSFSPVVGYDFMLEEELVQGRKAYRPYFVFQREAMQGGLLDDAGYRSGEFGQHYVTLEFGKDGTERFKNLTLDYTAHGRKNLDSDMGRDLAIIMDGKLWSAPRLNAVIYDGRAQIENIRIEQEARDLADILRAGALPAPVRIIATHTVAPSLGQDAIDSGVRAVIAGGIAVLAFMLIYYMVSGLVADVALVLDLVLLPGAMVLASGFLGLCVKGGSGANVLDLPVLTLPGIAGILLTIGVAVDANVLIFERIREEARIGKTIKAAVAAGYDRAFVTIVDANVTTLVTGVILFIAGSGPVRGFAVTLCAGIMVSMFTALVVTRMVFNAITNRTKITRLKMLSIIRETKINFLGKRGYAVLLSAAIIAFTWVMLVLDYRKSPANVLGVDFTGGAAVTFRVIDYDDKPDEAGIRGTLASIGVTAAHIQYTRPMDKSTAGQLLVRCGLKKDEEGDDPGDAVQNAILAAHGDKLLEGSQEGVGAQIPGELRNNALFAIGGAMLCIVAYISWRFEFGFAIGAIAALTHDVLITIGLFCLFGRQMSLPIIAALLTIVGYSVNDTIVVFDRIREDLKNSELRRKYTYKEICNLGLNQTLSRTLLTSLTTLIAVGMLLIFGGGAIFDFALALCIGVIVGTYSSIFVATPVAFALHREKKPGAKTSG